MKKFKFLFTAVFGIALLALTACDGLNNPRTETYYSYEVTVSGDSGGSMTYHYNADGTCTDENVDTEIANGLFVKFSIERGGEHSYYSYLHFANRDVSTDEFYECGYQTWRRDSDDVLHLSLGMDELLTATPIEDEPGIYILVVPGVDDMDSLTIKAKLAE